MKISKPQSSRANSKDTPELIFTLDQPVTRQMISRETGLSYATVCRRLKRMEFVQPGKYIGPGVYKKILVRLGYIDP
ncbi:MAG TPA: hypothetical protein VKZ54_06095 [Membranihabitans sp.]|nr:hypothetical protein [Membranihabitans sp.]